MKKKLFSIALIVVLISFTVAPLWGYSCFVYSADSGSATEQEKVDSSLSTYFNYRGGYFVASAGGAGAALQIARNYIDEFYHSSSNTTSIHSNSDFLAHVTFRNTNDHWGIYIDNNGVVFLDNLVKWLLGKNEFPNLYSGGSWGDSNITTDVCYDGFVYSGTLFYVVETNNNIDNRRLLFSKNNVKIGQPVAGITSEILRNAYFRSNSNNEEFWSEKSNSALSNTPTPINYTIDYFSDVSIQITMNRAYRSDALPYAPALVVTVPNANGVSNDYNSNLFAAAYTGGAIYKLSSSHLMMGNPAYICKKDNGINTFYCGWAGIDFGSNSVGLCGFREIDRNDKPQVLNTTVDFETNQFDRNDVGSEAGTAPGVEFVPKEETENNTYNYYNYNDYSEKQFIENYVEKYVVKKTIIDGSSQDPGDNPGGGGGSDTPGTGSGNITPDGNGGFNFTMPDIGWPDFSGFDFNISGLSEKFPFSIPFDLMAFFTVLNAEPETPEIQGQIDLGIVQWDIDWNLEDFDGLAALLRNLEFIGFCLALILITRSIIKG